MAVSRQAVLNALKHVVEPDRDQNIVRLDLVRNLQVSNDRVSFTVVCPEPGTPFEKQVAEACTRAIHDEVDSSLDVDVEVDAEMISLGDDIAVGDQSGDKEPENKGVQNTIAVASGKGGVGKSTVAVNLAISLAKQDYNVALVDTDIYGPSIPTMMGMQGKKPRVNDQRKIVPLEKHGIKLLSMGFMVDPNKAVIWRGPMVTKAIRQFLGDVHWGEIDYMVLDLPPGTGDIQLTIVQTIPLTGAIIVSTPQNVALDDARKGVAMFDNVDVPVLGIVENMAYFTPPDLPDRKYYLFGQHGAQDLADELEVPFLGEIPIEQSVREGGDEGEPVVLRNPDSLSAQAFRQIAERSVEQVEIRNATQDPTDKVEILYR
ncbi:MAG: Mrp/NBP35 family ATP-binding protein [Longimonas sp.]|uniref:Mrp/NBP35 family ATP-binding protein n=1 Tax=Longimonas sp. TaxID=2039626 RepID=UPI003346B595